MDKERRQKIQTIKLIITESLMFIVIILTVVTLSFVVMGYHFNDEGELEQSGLIGVDSTPTGASVTIDDELLSSKTNTSKILPEGEHTVLVEKPGYTSWRKTVSVHSGFLTKLSYPHLYLLDRETKPVKTLETNPTLYSISPLRDTIIFSENSKTLELLDLNSADPKTTEIDLLKTLNLKTLESPKILEWNDRGTRIIISYKTTDTHYAVLDLERPESSLDLTSTFGLKLSDLHFLNSSGDQLFVLENGHLRTLSISSKQLSSILADHVLNFNNFGPRAVFVASAENQKTINLYDNTASTVLALATSTAENARALISEYLGRPTLAFLQDNLLTIYRGDLPTTDVTPENPLGDPVGELSLSFTPADFKTNALEQIIVARADATFSVFDLETYTFSNYTLENSLTFWPDDYTIGVVSDGNLLLRDFDGQNLVKLGPAESGFPAVITKDNKYLYLVSNHKIVRETIK